MSWISDLYETYESNFDMRRLNSNADETPLPISHTTQNAQIEITIDQNGDFITAEAIADKDQALTVIPVTEDSSARASGPCAHPLEDKLEYIAGDFSKYTGKDNSKKHQLYIEGLSHWCASEYSCSEIKAIKTYVEKNCMMKDLAARGVLKTDGSKAKLTKDKIAGIDQQESFVRFSVYGGHPDAVYLNDRIFELYIKYYQSLGGNKSFCYVTGDETVCSQKHGAKIRSGGDKAKLISANDGSGFTYRGRFADASQTVSIGYEVSQKAHSALRWLVKKNGFYVDEMTVVAWEISGKEIPDTMAENIIDIIGEGAEEDGYVDDINSKYAMKLKSAIYKCKKELGDNSNIVVMGLQAATTGRLSICFYHKLRGSDFIDNIEKWYDICCWRWGRYMGTPSIKEIAATAFGAKNSKLLASTIKRLLPCIVENRPIPTDIVIAAVNAASNPNSYEKQWQWERAIGVTCGLIRKMRYDRSSEKNGNKREEWSMALDKNEKDRSYLFGRLLAVAQKVEEMALYITNLERRATSAEKWFQQFQNRPKGTWKVIRNNLQPYVMKLIGTGAYKYVKEMDDICSLIETNDFMSDERLSELFMLGYSCQLNYYRNEKEEKKEEM